MNQNFDTARLWYWKKNETLNLVFSHVYSGIHTHEAEEHFWWATTQACFFFLSWFIIKRVELDLHIIRRRFAYLQGENSRERGIQMSWATPPFWNSRRWERGRRAGGVFLFFKDFSSFFWNFVAEWISILLLTSLILYYQRQQDLDFFSPIVIFNLIRFLLNVLSFFCFLLSFVYFLYVFFVFLDCGLNAQSLFWFLLHKKEGAFDWFLFFTSIRKKWVCGSLRRE